MAKLKTSASWKPGQSGNPKGRVKRPEIEQLRQAIATVEKRKKKKLLVHFVEQAFKDNPTLHALMRKLLADKKAIEGAGGGPIEVQLIDYADIELPSKPVTVEIKR